jgi:superfamily I DNA/RNA helicase
VLKLYPKIGEKTAAEVWTRISASPDPLSQFERGVDAGGRGVGQSLGNLRNILRLIGGESMKRNPSESIRLIVERGYADYARSKFPNAQARLDDLEQLSQYAMRYEDVDLFLEEIALANPMAGEDTAVVGPEDEKIVLSSVHQSKGLEWRTVFVIWLSDGRFPSQRALRVPGGIVSLPETTTHPDFAGFLETARAHDATQLPGTTPPDPAPRRESDEPAGAPPPLRVVADEPRPQQREIIIPGEEEERRLFYVAITRARQELYLVFPVMSRDRGGMDVLMEPSRFVRELPGELYEKWVIGTE